MHRRIIGALIIVMVLASCGTVPSVAVAPTIDPTPDIQPTPAVVECRVEAAAFLTAVQPIASAWDDANKLANSTPRVSLAPVITQLQSIRRSVEQLPTPACAQSSRDALSQAMDQTINGYIAFLGQASDSLVQPHFKQASVSMQEFHRQMIAITTGVLPPVPTPEPTPGPTARPANGMTADEQQYADKLQAMFGKIGDHVMGLDKVSIRHFKLSGVTTNIVDFEITIEEAVYLDREGLHDERQAWGSAVVKEVSKRYPKGPLTVELTHSYDSFTYLKDTDCFFSLDGLSKTGYSHTNSYFEYHRDEAGKTNTRCY